MIKKKLTPKQKAMVRWELMRDPKRYDSDIALILGIKATEVAYYRRQKGYPHYSPYTIRHEAVNADLLADPTVRDTVLALKHRCSNGTVARYRAELGLPKNRGSGTRPAGEKTITARGLLREQPNLTDSYIAELTGVSFAHIARQRDLMGLPRSPKNNRKPSARKLFDYTEVDKEIWAEDCSFKAISIRHNIRYQWVTARAKEIGHVRNFKDETIPKTVLDLVNQPRRMTDVQIGIMLGVSPNYVRKIRLNAGIPRLEPGRPKYDERLRAQALLSESNRKSLEVIARETGLTVTTVAKERDKMAGTFKPLRRKPKMLPRSYCA